MIINDNPKLRALNHKFLYNSIKGAYKCFKKNTIIKICNNVSGK